MAIVLTSYQQAATFTGQRFNPVVLTENERVKVILACFEPGQFIPVHQPGVDLTLTILEGKALGSPANRRRGLAQAAWYLCRQARRGASKPKLDWSSCTW